MTFHKKCVVLAALVTACSAFDGDDSPGPFSANVSGALTESLVGDARYTAPDAQIARSVLLSTAYERSDPYGISGWTIRLYFRNGMRPAEGDSLVMEKMGKEFVPVGHTLVYVGHFPAPWRVVDGFVRVTESTGTELGGTFVLSARDSVRPDTLIAIAGTFSAICKKRDGC